MHVATLNARSDTIATKPMFREAFQRRRCLMPASGYYEWMTAPESKHPFYFTRADRQPMTIAAIHDAWVAAIASVRHRIATTLINSRAVTGPLKLSSTQWRTHGVKLLKRLGVGGADVQMGKFLAALHNRSSENSIMDVKRHRF
jgi:hypothetical protein